MDLSRYLEKTKQSKADFARSLDMPHSYVSMLIAGKVWPSRRFMARIMAATGGKVTPNDLFGVDEIKGYQQATKGR